MTFGLTLSFVAADQPHSCKKPQAYTVYLGLFRCQRKSQTFGSHTSLTGGLPIGDIYNAYIRKTRPHRVAWFIFLVLSVITFASQFKLGARASLVFYGWFVINNVILFSLSLRKNAGYGGVSAVNVVSLILAVAAIALWKTTNSPLVALICVLVADGIGALLIVIKAYKHPETETLFMWQIGCIATLLNVIAVGKLQTAILAAPIQVFLFNVAIVIAILLGRKTRPRGKYAPAVAKDTLLSS